MKELLFIGGAFFDYTLSKDTKWLLKYFTTDLEEAFLKYYYCMGEYEFFSPHTGYYCQKRWLRLLKKRHDYFWTARNIAKAELDSKLLAHIESGRCKCPRFL